MPLKGGLITKQRNIRRLGETLSNTEIFKYEDLRKFLIQWLISLENETVRVQKASGSKSTNSKSNFKDNKSRGRKELSVNATNIIKDVKCLMCKKGYALVRCRKFQELPSWRRREDPSDEVRECRLLTVTYGTISAPYLGIRTLASGYNWPVMRNTGSREVHWQCESTHMWMMC